MLYYYPKGGQLCYTTNFHVARKAMNIAMGRDWPVIAMLGPNKTSKFKAKFKK
jgi:hypothetical protein